MSTEGTGLRRAMHLSRRNKTGYRGVSWYPRYGKWNAQVMLDGKTHNLGYFEDIHDAGIAASDFRLQHEVELAASEERRRKGHKETFNTTMAKLSPEEHRERVRENFVLSHEKRSAASRKAARSMTAEERSERSRNARRKQLEKLRAAA